MYVVLTNIMTTKSDFDDFMHENDDTKLHTKLYKKLDANVQTQTNTNSVGY